jgi:hypothetical protein
MVWIRDFDGSTLVNLRNVTNIQRMGNGEIRAYFSGNLMNDSNDFIVLYESDKEEDVDDYFNYLMDFMDCKEHI